MLFIVQIVVQNYKYFANGANFVALFDGYIAFF